MTGNNVCYKCGSDLIKIGMKKICSNDNCDYQMITTDSKPWYKQMADDDSLWNENIIEHAPSIVAYEYSMLRKLLSEGSIYGVPIKIKDMFEVVLKFPVLILLAEKLTSKETKEKYDHIFSLLTCKPLSLGDWKEIAIQISANEAKRKDALMSLLKEVIAMYDSNKIVTWRNDTIGHGALAAIDTMNFIKSIESMLKLIWTHFNNCEGHYATVQLMLKSEKQYLALTGEQMARDINRSTGTLYADIGGEKTLLDPLVQYIEGGVYFFDSYAPKDMFAALLGYSTGNKIKQQPTKFKEIYKSLAKRNNILFANSSAEAKIHLRSQDAAVNNIMKSDHLIEFKYLSETIEKWINNNDNGIFLMQMGSGMGKTTFAKMLDGLAFRKIKFENTVCRAYYINNVYSYSLSAFQTKLNDILRQTDHGDILDGAIPAVDVESDNAALGIGKLINTLFGYYKNEYHKKKMILVIDGIDELPNDSKKSIVDLIPNPDLLDRGIYILLTCRPDNQISEYTKELLDRIHYSDNIVIENADNNYYDLLRKYIREANKDIDDIDVAQIIELSNQRFINVDILTKAYAQFGIEAIGKKNVVAEKKLLDVLLKLYGERYFGEMMKLLTVLAIVSAPVSVKQLSLLCGENEITFKQLCYLEELRPLIDISRTVDGNNIGVFRKEVFDLIRDKHGDIICHLVKEWTQYLNILANKEKTKIFQEEDLPIVLITMATLIDLYPEDTAVKLEKNISLIIRELGKERISGAFRDEQLHRAYYIYYAKINSLLKACITQDVFIDIGDYLNLMGTICERFFHSGDIQFAIEHLQEGIDVLCENKAQASVFAVSKAYGKLAKLYSKIGYKAQAEKYFDLSKKVHIEMKKSLPHNACNQFAFFCSTVEERLNEAKHFKNRNRDQEALNLLNNVWNEIKELEKQGFGKEPIIISSKINTCQLFGNIHKHDDPEKALDFMLQAQEQLQVLIENGVKDVRQIESGILIPLGQIYRKLKSYSSARECYDKSLKILEEKRMLGELIAAEQICTIYLALGNIELDSGRYQQAIEYFQLGIEERDKHVANGKDFEATLYGHMIAGRIQAHEKLGQVDKVQRDEEILKKINIDEELANHNANRDNDENSKTGGNQVANAFRGISESAQITLRKKSIRHIERRKYKSAVECLNGLISCCPETDDYWRRSYCYGEMGKNSEAIEDLIKWHCHLNSSDSWVSHVDKMHQYLSKINEFSRALLHLEFGWYVNKSISVFVKIVVA